MDVHDLTGAYALDALDADERERYEAHLGHCDRCREQLAAFEPALAALPYGVDAPAPPPALRARILDAARSDNVIPLRPRRWPVVATAASLVAAAAAIVWAVSLSQTLTHTRSERDAAARAVQVLADPTASTRALRGANGVVGVDAQRYAVIVFRRLARAPKGKTYEAWVMQAGNAPIPAGTFAGGEAMTVVRLRVRVPRGAVVGATVERAGGVSAPTVAPFASANV